MAKKLPHLQFARVDDSTKNLSKFGDKLFFFLGFPKYKPAIFVFFFFPTVTEPKRKINEATQANETRQFLIKEVIFYCFVSFSLAATY